MLVVGLLAMNLAFVQAKPVHLKRISFAERADGRGYVVRLHVQQPIQAFSHETPEASQALLKLYGTALDASFQKDKAKGPVNSYQVTESNGQVQVRFEFSADEQSVDVRAYQDGQSSDLLVSLTHANKTEKTSASVNVSSGGETAASSTVDSTETNGQPYVLSREERERWKLDCVVIDAGHGGHDPGSQGHGVVEKDVVLSIALKLGHYIKKNLDLKVVYTRKTDRFVPLHERGRIANEKCGKLFVSLHANSVGGSRRVQGTETYILGLHKEDQARRVMERENSVIELEENPDRYSGFNEDELVVQSLTQNMYIQESERLAEAVEHQFEHRAGRNSRGVKQAGFLVLWRASMPAVLVELGFVSNASEAAYLNSEQGQAYLASAVFRAVRKYKAKYEKGLDLVAEEE